MGEEGQRDAAEEEKQFERGFKETWGSFWGMHTSIILFVGVASQMYTNVQFIKLYTLVGAIYFCENYAFLKPFKIQMCTRPSV